jgi:hypothetical protein
MPDSEKENTSLLHKGIKLYTGFMDGLFPVEKTKPLSEYKPWQLYPKCHPYTGDPIIYGDTNKEHYNFK